MAVSTLKGVVNDNTILSNERVIDMDDVIAYLDPEVSQFTTMLMQVASKEAFSAKVEWLEDELFPRLATLSATASSADTAITVGTGQGVYLRNGDLVRNALTGECYKATADGSGTTWTVARAIGGVAAASSVSGADLVIIGNASLQGASLGTRLVTKRVAQYNYCQIQRQPYGFTNTLRASKLYGGPEPDKERKKKAVEHKRAIEYLLFFGARGLDTSGTNPVGYTGGALEFITTNIKNAAGSLTKANLDLYLRDILQHGSTNKVLFCAPTVAMAMSGFLRDAWSPFTTGGKLWGAKVDAVISGAYGFQIPVVVKRDWNDFSTANTQYGGYAFIIDMDYVQLRTLRNTQLLRDRQANDADSYDEEYLTELSLEFQHERAHGIIRGITG